MRLATKIVTRPGKITSSRVGNPFGDSYDSRRSACSGMDYLGSSCTAMGQAVFL
jgi:hypothetical protein